MTKSSSRPSDWANWSDEKKQALYERRRKRYAADPGYRASKIARATRDWQKRMKDPEKYNRYRAVRSEGYHKKADTQMPDDSFFTHHPAGKGNQFRRYAQIRKDTGFRSMLEVKTAKYLKERGVDFEYESRTVYYEVPARVAAYNPDLILQNGVIVELKGEWPTEDRQKHRMIKAQHPDLDVRIVFSNPQATIGKKSKTTYAMYCERLGIPYARKLIPDTWWATDKKADKARWAALIAATTKPEDGDD